MIACMCVCVCVMSMDGCVSWHGDGVYDRMNGCVHDDMTVGVWEHEWVCA